MHSRVHAALSKIFMTALGRSYCRVRKLMLDGPEVDYGIKSERRFLGIRQHSDGYCDGVFLFGTACGA